MMKDILKELIDQAELLAGKRTSEEIAEYLAENNVICPPVGIGDRVWFIVARGTFGTLLTTGIPVERSVDEIIYDGNIKIHSSRTSMDDQNGNLYGYWGITVFRSEDDAQQVLDTMRNEIGLEQEDEG